VLTDTPARRATSAIVFTLVPVLVLGAHLRIASDVAVSNRFDELYLRPLTTSDGGHYLLVETFSRNDWT